MALTVGMRLGPYTIIEPLGAGGMGEVYRAHDSRLGRDVAIKVLPVAFAVDPERLHRFEQEARATAALNHPNILAVYDIGQHEGVPFIVSELLEGETLREALAGGRLPLRKTIERRRGPARFGWFWSRHAGACPVGHSGCAAVDRTGRQRGLGAQQ